MNSPSPSYYNPPPVYEIDVLEVADTGEVCDRCNENHVVVKIAEELSGGWTAYERMCANCAYKAFDVDVKASVYDKGIED